MRLLEIKGQNQFTGVRLSMILERHQCRILLLIILQTNNGVNIILLDIMEAQIMQKIMDMEQCLLEGFQDLVVNIIIKRVDQVHLGTIIG